MAYRSSAIASAATGAITATPTGVQVGDYLGGLFTTDSSLATVSLPSGWVQRANINHAAGTPDGENTWYADKVADGSDSFQFNDNSSSNRSLVVAAWSGRDTVNPRSTAPVTTTNTTANGNPFTATYNGITAAQGDDVAIFFFGDQTGVSDRFITAPPTNYTERQDGVNQSWVATIGLDTRDNVNAGATGNFTSDWTVGPGFAGYGAVVVAIARAAAITDQPDDATAQAGDTATFSVTASGSPAFQWQIFDALGSAWSDVGGATSSSYTTPTLTRAEHGDMYRCVLDGGSETSTAATLRVTEIPASYSGIGLVVGDQHIGHGMVGGPVSIGQTVAVGLVTCRHTVNAVAWAPKKRLAGLVTSAHTVNAVARVKRLAVGLVTCAHTVNAVARRKVKAVGLVTCAHTVNAVAWAPKKRLAGLVTSAHTVNAVTRRKVLAVGLVTSRHLVNVVTLGGDTVVPVGLVTSAHTVNAVAWAPKKRNAGIVTSAHTALAVTRRKVKAAGLVQVTHSVQPVAWAPKKRLAGFASTAHTALAVTKAKRKAVGLVTAAHTVQALVVVKRVTIGQATTKHSVLVVEALGPSTYQATARAQFVAAGGAPRVGDGVAQGGAGAIGGSVAAGGGGRIGDNVAENSNRIGGGTASGGGSRLGRGVHNA